MFTPNNRNEWREWLKVNHKTCNEIWLVYYKKHTERPTVSYNDSVEEAICYGWIDGIKIRIDDEAYCHRFTPRRANSNWSETNIKRATLMIEKGLMSPSGLKIFEEAMKNPGRKILKHKEFDPEMPGDFKLVLEQNKAYVNFTKFSESYRNMCIGWINAAKRENTRKQRITEVADKSSKGEKIGMK